MSSASKTETAGQGCLFCAPGAGDNVVLAENDTCYARWDNYPLAAGHAEILPKRHVESVFDLLPREVTDLYALLVQARDVIDEQHGPDGYTVGVNEGRAAGRTIDHLHVHLIPRVTGDVPDPAGGIRAVLPGPQPELWTRPFEVHAEQAMAIANEAFDTVVESWPKE